MVSHQPVKFGYHRHCGSGDMFLVVEEGEDFTSPHLNLPLLVVSKVYGMPCQHTKFQDVDTIIYGCVQ